MANEANRCFIAMHDSNQTCGVMDITHRMRHAGLMRTTIDIEDDVFLVVKEIALQQKMSAGNVVSKLLREAFQPRSCERKYRNGVPLLACRRRVTTELVNRLRDEDE